MFFFQQDRLLNQSKAGPGAIKLPHVFPDQFEIDPVIKCFGSSQMLATWTLSLAETRKAEIFYGFTHRLSLILMEAIKREDTFVHLQGLDELDYDTQRFFTSRLLKPFLKVRSIAGLVSFFVEKYGKADVLTTALFDAWGQFQLSKISHPCWLRPQDSISKNNVLDGLLSFPQKNINLPNDYFAPLPALPANNKLWFDLTHRLEDGANPMESIGFFTWVAAHDYQLGRALIAPLFEIGHFTHAWSFFFESHHIVMAPGAPQIKMPQVLRILRLSCMFLASKILQVSLTQTYPQGVNPTGEVFLPLSPMEAKVQTISSDLLLNKEQIQYTGYTDPMWSLMFSKEAGIHRFYDQLTSLKTQSLFHLSRPVSGISPETWHSLRPNRDLAEAHNYILAREKFVEKSWLTYSPLNFAESRFSQIIPSGALFWLKDAK